MRSALPELWGVNVGEEYSLCLKNLDKELDNATWHGISVPVNASNDWVWMPLRGEMERIVLWDSVESRS